jgi:hypothetical protein
MAHRPIGHLLNLQRSALDAHQASAVEKNLDPQQVAQAAATPSQTFPPLAKFRAGAISEFLWDYTRHVLSPRPAFPKPDARSVVKINDHTKLALAGDWASGTEESARIGGLLHNCAADYTIHLGDVYFVGQHSYIEENCRGQRQKNGYDPVLWPKGSLGSFAMYGNHEAHARNKDYYHWIQNDLHQPSTCFCLYNDSWCILGLDTGYNSEGIPFLGWLAEHYGWRWPRPACDLPDAVLDWLEKTVAPILTSGHAIILLTHHQYISSFDLEYDKAAKQLSKFPAFAGRPVLWFWAHEHRLAGYDLCGDAGIRAHGRCIGHGGMPGELGKITAERPLQFCDQRYYDPDSQKIVPGPTAYGVNGYAVIQLQGPILKVEYRDITDACLVSEQWQSAGGNATLVSQSIDPSVKV